MTDSTIRVGLVGAGPMAEHHARAIGYVPGAKLVAVADPRSDRIAAIGARVPGVAGFSSLGQLLTGAEVDVVHVCTPPASHAAVAMEAIAAGKHVYIEKPFTERVEDAEAVLAAAEARGLKVSAGHQLLFEHPTLEAARLRQAIGRLIHIESYFAFRPVRRGAAGGADLQLLDILPHPVYLLLRFLEGDEPLTISALEVNRTGTLHALVRRGEIPAVLTATLTGRPVESYLRLVGTNGSIHADFVRGSVQRLIGPGAGGIDKILAPYSMARQLLFRTTGALYDRLAGSGRHYPGLVRHLTRFYQAIRANAPSPVSARSIIETTEICEAAANRMAGFRAEQAAVRSTGSGPAIAITGGTGFLGRAIVRRLLSEGRRVRVIARGRPGPWEAIGGAEYVEADVGDGLDPAVLSGCAAVIHCAAATSGGWDAHQRNSIDATKHLLTAAASAGVRRVVHVSSLAVLEQASPLTEHGPLVRNERGSGPYVWGKLVSEREAKAAAAQLGLELTIVRPGAIVDYDDFDPPGRLGKRLGNIYVAVGWPGSKLGVVSLGFCAEAIAWMATNPGGPAVINLVDPVLPARRALLAKLKTNNPDLSTIWLPPFVLHPLSWFAWLLQKILRPGKAAMSVAKVFASPDIDTEAVRGLAARIEATRPAGVTPPAARARHEAPAGAA